MFYAVLFKISRPLAPPTGPVYQINSSPVNFANIAKFTQRYI